MSDAQPGDQLVAVLEEIAHNTSMSVPMGVWPVHHHADNVRRCIAIAAAALPIAREMAERERELVAALEDVLAHTSNRGCLCSTNDRLIRAALDRAHAAGVEVTGHE